MTKDVLKIFAIFTGLEKLGFLVQKSLVLKVSPGGRCVPHNFVHLVTLRGTHVSFIVDLVVHQIKYIMER